MNLAMEGLGPREGVFAVASNLPERSLNGEGEIRMPLIDLDL